MRQLLALAQQVEGIARNVGMHAGGVLIAPGKLTDFCPLYTQGTDGGVISQFDKDDTPQNRLLYAYFAMEGFDKEKLTKEISSAQARTLKKKLSQYTDTNVTPKRGAAQVRREGQEAPVINWII